MDVETKIKKAHITLMRHSETCLYSSVIMAGKTSVVDNIPTARTNGWDTEYGRKFMESLSFSDTVGLVLHENLHKALRHIARHMPLWKEDPQLANASADYVANDIIMSMQDKTFCTLPEGRLHHPKFHNWSVREVYDFLKTGRDKDQEKQPGQSGKPGGKGQPKRGKDNVEVNGEKYPLGALDEHDTEPAEGMDPEELKTQGKQINEALQQGGLLAGRFGQKIPRAIGEMLEPKIDWRTVMRDFVSQHTSGKDEFSYRRYNRRRIADDYYLPSTISETVGEIINASDTSGSITPEILNEQASELCSLCDTVEPEKIRQLWWDTKVHGEQVFEPGQYGNLKNLLKPMGGGGTHAGCIASYIKEKNLSPECILVMTDGYTEQPIDWPVDTPTLWLVTHNKSFQPPAGGVMVMIDE